jgi:hypothetical protein
MQAFERVSELAQQLIDERQAMKLELAQARIRLKLNETIVHNFVHAMEIEKELADYELKFALKHLKDGNTPDQGEAA